MKDLLYAILEGEDKFINVLEMLIKYANNKFATSHITKIVPISNYWQIEFKKHSLCQQSLLNIQIFI